MTQALPGTPFLAAAALAGDLDDWGPLDEATGAPMQTSGTTLWSDGDQEVGVVRRRGRRLGGGAATRGLLRV